MLRVVLDTNVLVAARRSGGGASNALLRAADGKKLQMLVSVPLFLEYEAVLTRPEHLLTFRLTERQVQGFLGYLAGIVEPVELHYLWRAQPADIADEMVLETAINGRADCLVTFNVRHFEAALRFGIEAIRPDEALRRMQ